MQTVNQQMALALRTTALCPLLMRPLFQELAASFRRYATHPTLIFDDGLLSNSR